VIWVWINAAVRWLKLMLVPPADYIYIPKISPHAPCPSCGWRDGQIRAVVVAGKTKVEHICKVCSARWNENPVVDTSLIQPAETPKE
jgi:hypothetical protein